MLNLHRGKKLVEREPEKDVWILRDHRQDGSVAVSGIDKSHLTNGEGGDTTIPSPGRSPKQPLPGVGLHDPLHGRQACPESNSFHQGVSQIYPR